MDVLAVLPSQARADTEVLKHPDKSFSVTIVA